MKSRLKVYIFGILVLYFGFRVAALVIEKTHIDFSDVLVDIED